MAKSADREATIREALSSRYVKALAALDSLLAELAAAREALTRVDAACEALSGEDAAFIRAALAAAEEQALYPGTRDPYCDVPGCGNISGHPGEHDVVKEQE